MSRFHTTRDRILIDRTLKSKGRRLMILDWWSRSDDLCKRNVSLSYNIESCEGFGVLFCGKTQNRQNLILLKHVGQGQGVNRHFISIFWYTSLCNVSQKTSIFVPVENGFTWVRNPPSMEYSVLILNWRFLVTISRPPMLD